MDEKLVKLINEDKNIVVLLDTYNSHGLIDQRNLFCNLIKFDIKTPSSERLITLLSGGNQQKVLLSRWLLRELKIIILDEPTRGVDIGAKTEVLKLINDLANQGMSVMIMTSEMNDLLSLSDRIFVMANGKITAEFKKNQVTQEQIFKASVN